MTHDHDPYGVPRALQEQIGCYLSQSEASSPALDTVILNLGAHQIAHFIATTHNRDSAELMKSYLARFWPAYYVLIERLLFAARREQNAELMSDFGQS